MMDTRQELLDIYTGRATRRYGLADVNQLQHALQAATLAHRGGEKPAMIAACLLHDVGHMLHRHGENAAEARIDDRHEELGARWLAERFAPEVSEPVRLHVAAKRYLVAADKHYFAKLSADSVRSLELQGGPMSEAEMESFAALPYHEQALRLRQYDEQAKDPQARTLGFEALLDLCGPGLR